MNTNTVSINKNEMTQIYNLEGDKTENQLKLQFNQFIKYYNFRKKFKESIESGYYNKNNKPISNQYIQNEFCLIDSEWIEKWRKHVGYKDIVNYIKQKEIRRDLNENDYSWIKPIIEENAKENHLPLLNNGNIYQENNEKINPEANFYIINTECYHSFIFKDFIDNIFNYKTYYFDDRTAEIRHIPIKFIKKKIILIFDLQNLQIIFKHNNSYIDILLKFEENNEKRKKILDELEQNDITIWINDNDINLNSDIEKTLNLGCKVTIINKTLRLKRKKDMIKNSIIPNNYYNEQLLNADSKGVPKELKNEIKKKMTIIKKRDLGKTMLLILRYIS